MIAMGAAACWCSQGGGLGLALAAMAAADAAAGTQWGARACGVAALAGLGALARRAPPQHP